MTPDDDAVAELAGFVVAGEAISIDQIRRALLEKDVALEAIFEAAGLGLVLGDMTGQTIHTNQLLLSMLGYDEKEMRALGIQGITHPDDLEKDLELFTELLQGKRDRYQLEKRFIRKDGSIMWGRITIVLLNDLSGHPHFGLGLVQDVTEAHTAEEIRDLLEVSEANQRRALELNDTIVQGLTVAKLALDMEWKEKAGEAVADTLDQARSIVSRLLEDAESRGAMGPGSLVRETDSPRQTDGPE